MISISRHAVLVLDNVRSAISCLVLNNLCATMKQDRLVYLMVLHIHRELTDKLDLISIANLFVSGSEHRQTLFGKFTSSDI